MKKLTLGILAATLAVPTITLANTTAPSGKTEYFKRSVCGRVKPHQNPPLSHAWGDVDGDGKDEHFLARWDHMAQYSQDEKPNQHIFKQVRSDLFNGYNKGIQYTCADVRLQDLDNDGDLDLVYANTRTAVVYENKAGKFTLQEQHNYDNTFSRLADPRISFKDVDNDGDLDIVVTHKSLQVQLKRNK